MKLSYQVKYVLNKLLKSLHSDDPCHLKPIIEEILTEDDDLIVNAVTALKKMFSENAPKNTKDHDLFFLMGFCYEHGIGVEKSENKSRGIYACAIQKRTFIEIDQYEEAIKSRYSPSGKKRSTRVSPTEKLLNKSAEAGYAEAKLALANILLFGNMHFSKHVSANPDDIKSGLELLNQAIESGCTDAQITLAIYHAVGLGVQRDLKKAIELCSNAYQARVARMDSLGGWDFFRAHHLAVLRKCFRSFESETPASEVQAFYNDLAHKGHARACLRLADIHLVAGNPWHAYPLYLKTSNFNEIHFQEKLMSVFNELLPHLQDSLLLKSICSIIVSHLGEHPDNKDDGYNTLSTAEAQAESLKSLVEYQKILCDMLRNNPDIVFNPDDTAGTIITRLIAEYVEYSVDWIESVKPTDRQLKEDDELSPSFSIDIHDAGDRKLIADVAALPNTENAEADKEADKGLSSDSDSDYGDLDGDEERVKMVTRLAVDVAGVERNQQDSDSDTEAMENEAPENEAIENDRIGNNHNPISPLLIAFNNRRPLNSRRARVLELMEAESPKGGEGGKCIVM